MGRFLSTALVMVLMGGAAMAQVHVAFEFDDMFGSCGNGQRQFLDPQGLAMDMQGMLYVADTGNDRVQKLRADGAFVAEVGGFGWGDGQFNKPRGVAVGKGLEVYVADSRNQRIQIFNLQLRLLGVIGGRDATGSPELGELGGVALSDADVLVVTDIDADQQVQIDTHSRIDRSFGGFGYGAGRVRYPLGLAFADQHVYVCDSRNGRIAVFDRFGNYRKSLGDDVLMEPSGVCAGPESTLIVADAGHHRVVVFDLKTGEVAGHIGGPDVGKGPMMFQSPKAVAMGRAGMLFVLDSGNCRIQRLKMQVLRRE